MPELVQNALQPMTRARIERESASSTVVALPTSALTWEGFRAWANTDACPEHGHFSFLRHEVVIDMSPERLGSHNGPKSELHFVLLRIIREGNLGFLFIDGVRISHEQAMISHEPDLVFVSRGTLESGTARLIPSADGRDYCEILGTPDLVVEVVSPPSVTKDYHTLRERYHAAGIPEYWLVDAREETLVLEILRHTPAGYEPMPDVDGWVNSPVLQHAFRLERQIDPLGPWVFTLHTRSAGVA